MLKTADQIIGPALEEMYRRRPESFKHLNLRQGVFWHPFAAQRAQASLALQHLYSLIASNRLTAEGQALRDYVASEFTDPPSPVGSFAKGEITLSRPEGLRSGDIPKGSRFIRRANLETQIPLPAAEYETLADLHFDVGQLTGSVPIQAVTDGPAPNHPIRTDPVDHGVIYKGVGLFDTNLTVSEFSAAGGSSVPDDEFVRMYARASAKGQYGPTVDASRFGALKGAGVRRVLAYDDGALGAQRILVADSSWASSTRWAQEIQQVLYDEDFVGFGCRVLVIPVRNKVVAIEATVILRDWNFISDTLEIDEAIRRAARSYFDDRPDWHIWKTRGLRSAITLAHQKIMKCDSVVVKDVDGKVLSEIASPDYQSEQFHYYLANNAVTITYRGPG